MLDSSRSAATKRCTLLFDQAGMGPCAIERR